MISFFRRIQSTWLVLGLFGLILVAFVITGVNLPGGGGIGSLAPSGTEVAKIGRSSIEIKEVLSRVQAQFEAAKRQQPDLEMKAFVNGGGVEQVIEQMITARAFGGFGRNEGMGASKRLIDGEIASIPAFNGPTGAFDRNVFLSILDQQRLTEAGVRDDIGRDKMATMMVVPAAAATRVPMGIATPVASLLLETRRGQVVIVPNSAVPSGSAPTDAELTAYYKANIARYTTPETRTLRYANFDRSRFDGQAAPTDAEIAAAYKAKQATYAGSETRILTQAILPSEAAAKSLAGKIASGTAITAAATASGTEATTLSAQAKASYAGLSSDAVSTAAFDAAEGAVIGPLKSGLGWHVVRVDKIVRASGKTLADVRPELVTELTKSKTDGLIADFVTKIEDAIDNGSTFDDVVKAENLAGVVTPGLSANGTAPTDTAFKLPVEFAPILRDAFQAELDDDASVISLPPGKSYVLYDLERITPATPQPLAMVRTAMLQSFVAERANRAARATATTIAAKLNKGISVATAMAQSGVALPVPRPLGAQRLELSQAKGPIPPALQSLFSMNRGQARIIQTSDGLGWYVVVLQAIIRGDINASPELALQTQQQMARTVADEYVMQFGRAIQKDLSVRRNPAAIAQIKRDLIGAAAR